MAISWPASPTNGQTFTESGITYTWNGVAWINTITNTPAGTAGISSVTATSPIASSGGTAPNITIDQTLLSITNSQVSDFTAGTVAYAVLTGTATYATTSGTATYSTTSGTATYSTTSGTAVSISGSITKSKVSDFTSGTVTAISGSITKSQVSDFTAGTVAYASLAGTATYATTSGTATYSTTSGTAISISGSITKSQVSDFTAGTVTTISGSITKSQVSDFTSGTAIPASHTHGNISNTGTLTTVITPSASVAVLATNSSNTIGLLGTATSVSTQFLRGDGTWQVPAGGSSGVIPNFRVFPTGSYFTVKATGSTSSTILTMTAIPFWVSTSTTFTKIGTYVSGTGSSSAFRLGIWNNNATTDKPDTLFADYGTVSTTSTGFKEVTGQTITLSAGLWWIGGVNTGSPGATIAATTIGFPLYPIPHTSAPTSTTQYNAYSGTYVSGTLPTFVGASTPATQGFLVWLGL